MPDVCVLLIESVVAVHVVESAETLYVCVLLSLLRQCVSLCPLRVYVSLFVHVLMRLFLQTARRVVESCLPLANTSAPLAAALLNYCRYDMQSHSKQHSHNRVPTCLWTSRLIKSCVLRGTSMISDN